MILMISKEQILGNIRKEETRSKAKHDLQPSDQTNNHQPKNIFKQTTTQVTNMG